MEAVFLVVTFAIFALAIVAVVALGSDSGIAKIAIKAIIDALHTVLG